MKKLALLAALALAFAGMMSVETADLWLADRTLTIVTDCGSTGC